MGNSEVGHNALGAGRIFEQGAKLVQNAIDSGELFKTDTWDWLTELPRKKEGTIHLIGLLSDGNVHAHQDHLHSILRHLAESRVQQVRVHTILDGRDVSERSAEIYLERLESLLNECRTGGLDYQIASGGIWMVITMDRYEAEWDMVERGWNHHVHGEGRRFTWLSKPLKHSEQKLSGSTNIFPLCDR